MSNVLYTMKFGSSSFVCWMLDLLGEYIPCDLVCTDIIKMYLSRK